MTPATRSPHGSSSTAAPSRRAPEPEPALSALLVVRSETDAVATIRALAGQTRRPQTLLLVDGTRSGLSDADALVRLARDKDMRVLQARLPASRGLRRALPDLIGSLPDHEDRRDLVWLLTSRCQPEADALATLVGATGRGVGMATPKLVHAEDPSLLVRQGLQMTRGGRLVPRPQCGEPDQGQHDDEVDVLAGPIEGLLVDRESYLALRGHDPRLGDLGGDLDLGWRAHRIGHRVVAVPGARVAVVPTAAERHPGLAHQAQARRVSLARGPVWAYPFRALGGAAGSLLLALLFVLVRRTGQARDELARVRGSLDPRTLLSLRSRGHRPTVARAGIGSLFVTPSQARQRVSDELRASSGPGDDVAARAVEPDALGVLRSPVPYLALAVVAMSAWAGRQITGELRYRADAGLVGGELLGGRATAGGLFAAWRDAWSGAGVGSATELSPGVLLLAAGSWVVEHLPGGSDADSPAGIVIAGFVLLALPLAAVVAYRSARVVTSRRWIRALLALGWVSTGVAAAAAGEGRLGPLVALVLLPRIAAGLVRASSRGHGVSDAIRTGLWTAVLGAVMPGLALPVLLVGLVLLLAGAAGRRGRGIALVAVPLLLAGPWLLTLRAEPTAILGGWGATRTGATEQQPWELAAALPGGPGHIPAWWYLPVLLVAVLGLVLSRRRVLPAVAGLVTVLGAAAAVGAPHVDLGVVAPGLPDAGLAAHPWPGTGGLLVALGVLALAGLGLDALPRAAGRSRRALLTIPVVALTVGVVGSAVMVADASFGDELTTWRDPRPQVAVAAAEGPLASRTLVLTRDEDGISYQLIGREPGSMSRDVPALSQTAEEGLGREVASLLGVGPAGDTAVDDALGTWGVGYVTMRDPSTDDTVLLDAAPGFARMGSSAGVTTWSVRPEITGTTTPSRVRIVDGDSPRTVSGLRDHSATDGAVDLDGGRELVVGESIGWTEHASVLADGRAITLDTRSAVPTYQLPEGASEISIDVATGHRWWKLLQAVALVVALYLALPTERRPDPEDER